ncbi:MAG: hypothetical protein ABW352_09620 [Polyangiales bacterium]
MGPETSWQILCAPDDPTESCGTSEKPHGPLDGRDAEDDDDDYKFKVSCRRPGSGLVITIEDEGRERNVDKQQEARPRSILSISRANPEKNTCTVAVTEYPLGVGAGERKMQDTCEGTDRVEGEPGSCVLEGSFDSNGYAFEGSIQCDGLRYKNAGPAAWILRAASPNNDEPVKLQIANCD